MKKELPLVSTRLQNIRMERGFTQAQLSRRAHVSIGSISDIENGGRRPRDPTIEALAKALGVEPPYFFCPDTEMRRWDHRADVSVCVPKRRPDNALVRHSRLIMRRVEI